MKTMLYSDWDFRKNGKRETVKEQEHKCMFRRLSLKDKKPKCIHCNNTYEHNPR